MKDETLRENRLVFYKDDIEQIDKLLKEFLSLSGAKSIFFIDKDGHPVTQQGKAKGIDPDTLSALIAGSFAATKEMARILGETEFSVLFHEGKKDNIHISLVGEQAILAILFDDTTTVGMIRLYSKEIIAKVDKILSIASKKTRVQEDISEGFSDTAKNKVDDIFGE